MRIVASVALTLVLAWSGPAFAQPRPAGFPDVIGALKATPGCLGVETAHTPGGKRVIFAWFESKKALVDWYHGDVHQKAMKTAFPDLRFDRQPLPDLAEDSGPILAIVSVKLIDAPMPMLLGLRSMRIRRPSTSSSERSVDPSSTTSRS